MYGDYFGVITVEVLIIASNYNNISGIKSRKGLSRNTRFRLYKVTAQPMLIFHSDDWVLRKMTR